MLKFKISFSKANLKKFNMVRSVMKKNSCFGHRLYSFKLLALLLKARTSFIKVDVQATDGGGGKHIYILESW